MSPSIQPKSRLLSLGQMDQSGLTMAFPNVRIDAAQRESCL